MKSIFDACTPRPDIIAGQFNPEVFTASLKQVIEHYRGNNSAISTVYTDPVTFFTEATFPTEGLRNVLQDVFGRISGDASYPAIHRLETSFGGGKTHSLIACCHLAHRGSELAGDVKGIIDPKFLPAPGEVSVIGVPGDSLPVHEPKGQKLQPYTLWGEIAFQVGGADLYRAVENDARSAAAPGSNYFETVLGGRKALIMLDELAQYAARLEAAQSGGGDQLAAFLMALHGYARDRAGIAIVLTLASQADAFSGQTSRLQKLIAEVTGSEIEEDEAISIAEKAESSIRSVVARDATTIVPVQASEISRVLAKRLFVSIDTAAASATAKEYAALYKKSEGLLPEQATRAEFAEQMAAHYPFHPTFTDFLGSKLSQVETFQGTRGVLRVLSLAVRNLWKNKQAIPMIHACHLDMRDARIVSEITGRTGAADLLAVLNTDVGGVDTSTIEGGRSNAQLADQKNPHPEGYPMVEWTWKTVFLHSLVGRSEGLGSNVFGLTEADALFAVSFPGLTPPQIATALKEIETSAFYLRHRDGRYYASLDPSINMALAKIRRALSGEEVSDLLHATTRKVIKGDGRTFKVYAEITDASQIPDNQDQALLGLVSLDAQSIDPEAFVTTRGPGTPRLQQNLIFLLVPDTVLVKDQQAGELPSMSEAERRAERSRQRLLDLAKAVLARRKLRAKPSHHGIQPNKITESDFDHRSSVAEQGLLTAVAETYSSLWFPSSSGNVVRKEIKVAAAEGGQDMMNAIREVLLKERELVTSAHITQADILNLGKLFFHQSDHASLDDLHRHFCERRTWPVLDSRDVLDRIARSGAEHGQWVLYRMGGDGDDRPAQIYSRDIEDVPLGLEIRDKGWSLMTIPGAKKRGWMESAAAVDKVKLRSAVESTLGSSGAITLGELREQTCAKVGEVHDPAFQEVVEEILRSRKAVTYQGKKDAKEKPAQLVTGSNAIMLNLKNDDVLVTKAVASERGWLETADLRFSLTGEAAKKRLMPILSKLGGFYRKGAKSTLTSLNLGDLDLPAGGKLRLELTGATPESLKLLDEFFEILADQVSETADTYVELEIDQPAEGCALIEQLKPTSEK